MRPALLALAVLSPAATAHEMDHGDHTAPAMFSAIRVELDYAPGGEGLFTWEVDGWIGGDAERVWVRSEGDVHDGDLEDGEVQLYYGWNVGTYWDVLVGIRQDFGDHGRTHLAASVVGLAPHWFETEASLFLSDEGDISARIGQSVDLLLTQRLIAEPHAEINLHAEDIPELNVGAGFSDIEIGLQLRYEISRRFAPYIDAVWAKKLGETAGRTRAAGLQDEEASFRVGIRFLL